MNGCRIIIPLIIIASLIAQQTGTGQGQLGGSGFFINNLSFDWSDLNKNLQVSGKLKTLEFGFKQVGVAYSQGKKQQTLNMEFQGPEVIISGMEILANSHSPNWIAKIKSRYQQQRQQPAVKGVSIIATAVDSFSSIYGRNAESYDELVIKNYIRLDKYPFDQKKWHFAMPTPDKIIATLPSRLPSRSDQKIIYDMNIGQYYGDYQPPAPIDSIPWKITFSIQEITQTFSTEAKFSYTAEETSFEFFQKRGKFNIAGISLEAIPLSNINDLAQFRLSNLGLETHDLAFSGTMDDSIPQLHQAQGRFILRNLDVNIPTSLSEDPEFAIILEKLGIWNGVFRIRLVDIGLKIINERMGEIKVRFQSPFINITLDGDISFYQTADNTAFLFQQTVLRINPVSLGIRSMIRNWEKDKNLTLPRKNGAIVLNLNGPVSRPKVDGLNY
tara:strand:- start:2407 stop:3732 length:1326 start_codon:yes stop_codon:yes gene_type:complete